MLRTRFWVKKSHLLTRPARSRHSCGGNCSPPWARHQRRPLEMTPEGSSSSPGPSSRLCIQKNLMLAKFCPSSSPPDLLGFLLAQLLGATWIQCDFLSGFWAKFSTGEEFSTGCEERRVSSAPAKLPAQNAPKPNIFITQGQPLGALTFTGRLLLYRGNVKARAAGFLHPRS